MTRLHSFHASSRYKLFCGKFEPLGHVHSRSAYSIIAIMKYCSLLTRCDSVSCFIQQYKIAVPFEVSTPGQAGWYFPITTVLSWVGSVVFGQCEADTF